MMLIVFFVISITKIAEMSKEIHRAIDELVIHSKHTNSPQKPIQKQASDREERCPVCNHYIYRYNPFCSNCGQRLDWSDDTE